MDQTQTKEILHTVKKSLDGVLLRDRAQLNALMQRVRQRIREQKPTDQIVEKLKAAHTSALQRAQKRADQKLTLDYPEMLPISGRRDDIRKLIEENQVVIVCGTTGSGKTTQLPKMVLEAGAGKTGRVGITQPRRLAATGMARRVGEEMKTDYGRGVGCQVRFDDQTCDETIIKFMTDGILLAETQHDRHLLQYDCIVIDEAHERSLNIDFLLGYLKTLMPVRPDLKIVISSATLDAEAFSAFFDDAPVIGVEGRTYPVEDFFLPPGKDEELDNHILRALRWISDVDNQGDVLIFLPGEREIRDAAKKLEGQRWKETEVLPLYGRLSMNEQQRVFKVGGRRRIILATNVAETSITIPGIHYVIDSGLVRLSRYNPRTQVQGLQIEQVSQASARQRRGRCGRITDGICIYLYDQETLDNSAAYTDPEIRRTSLAGVILQMDLLGLPPIDRFPLIDPPQSSLINEGYRTLQDIGAIDEERRLTPLGREISQFPIDPHLARMVVQARDEGVLNEVLILTAFLSIQDVRERPAEKAEAADLAHKKWLDPKSDFIAVLNLWNFLEQEGQSHGQLRKLCQTNFVNYRRVIEWRNLYQDLRQTVRDLKWNIHHEATKFTKEKNQNSSRSSHLRGEPNNTEYDLIHRSLLAGLPTNIGLKGEERELQGARGRKFFIFPGSALFKKPPEWVMTFALVETTKVYARIVAEINPEWVVSVAPHLCKSVYTKPEWNPEKGFVYAKESVVSGGLTLTHGKNVHFGPIHPEEARKIFIRDALVPGNLNTHGGWLKLHQRMLDDIASLEEKIRRPGALLDSDAIYEHFDRVIPENVYSVKTLEQWLRKSKRRIAMKMQDALFPQSATIRNEDYPDELIFYEEPFQLIYTFDPGDKLDGIGIVCPSNKLAFLPDWAPDWLVPGWLEEKVNRLLRTLPKNLQTVIAPIDQTARAFRTACCQQASEKKGLLEAVGTTGPLEAGDTTAAKRTGPTGPLLTALSRWLQQEFKLPVDASDFDESALPNFLRMKVIETHGDEIVKIHTSVSDEHRQNLQMNSAELALAKWTLPPQKKWPGDSLPEFIIANDAAQTRGYPALTDERTGVGRKAFLCPIEAERSHQAGLARLFRIQQADQVKYVEKRPPLTPTLQLTLSAIDSDFLVDLVNVSAVEALTNNERMVIRDAQVFAERAAYARTVLYETLDENARLLETMIEQREAIVSAIADLSADFDTLHDLEMQLAFLFRPGFLKTRDVFGRYPRYLKAMQMRIQRIRNNPPADLRKLEEIEPFQSRLSEKLLESENISEAYGLLEFAMLLEEFRVNRFAPEIKTPQKISAQRLDEAWQKLQ
ncbi:MAG: ATP-dependent RNA helicase HrpA [Pontiellaceae bacterium]|nr:ATP-dependent RNA helicase HrpA [Pontiellaceae bacterium]